MSRVAVFAPHPLLTVAMEARGNAGDEIHLHAGGQGVWVARMAGELGAEPVLCCFVGGEVGALLATLLDELPGRRCIVRTAGSSGCYVVDRRNGGRRVVSSALSPPPSRHELDDLFSTTTSTALGCAALVVTNPFPGETLPLEVYGNLVADVRAADVPVLVDLSAPRLDSALAGRPELVKLNDWELGEYVQGSVDGPERLRAGAERLRAAGAGAVIVTRGAEPGLVLRDERAWELVPPRFERGSREGCGDSMMGSLAAGWAAGMDFEANVVRAAGAGAANFLRHGLGTGSRRVVDELAARVELRPL